MLTGIPFILIKYERASFSDIKTTYSFGLNNNNNSKAFPLQIRTITITLLPLFRTLEV